MDFGDSWWIWKNLGGQGHAPRVLVLIQPSLRGSELGFSPGKFGKAQEILAAAAPRWLMAGGQKPSLGWELSLVILLGNSPWSFPTCSWMSERSWDVPGGKAELIFSLSSWQSCSSPGDAAAGGSDLILDTTFSSWILWESRVFLISFGSCCCFAGLEESPKSLPELGDKLGDTSCWQGEIQECLCHVLCLESTDPSDP